MRKINDRLDFSNQGFTLIELLIVIAVVAILATVVFVALNPVARFEDARNSRRWSDVNAILSSVKLSQVDKRGYIDSIKNMTAGSYYQIGIAGDDPGCSITCNNPATVLEATCIELTQLVDDGYLPAIPMDPNATGVSAQFTHYYISKTSTGSISIGACDEELGSGAAIPEIIVSR